MLRKAAGYFQTLDPAKRRIAAVGGAALALFAVLALAVVLTDGQGARKLPFVGERKIEYSLLNGRDPRAVANDALAGRVKKLSEEFAAVKLQASQQGQKIEQALGAMQGRAADDDKRSAELAGQVKALSLQLDEAKKAGAVPLPALPPAGGARRQAGLPGAENPPGWQESRVTPEGAGLKIRVVGGGAPAPAQGGKDGSLPPKSTAGALRIKESINDPDRDRQGNKIDPILPAGSILSGTLVTGLDAPSSNQARRDPFPALLRVKQEAILPNRYRVDIRECFLVAGGYGDLSSERAYLRAESLSCVRKDGSVIDAAMDAYAVGEDGKAGVRGRVVSKNGQIIANSLMSGFVAGLGKSFTPQRIQPVNLNAQSGTEQGYQYPSPEMLAGQAMAGGVRGAAEQIAEYYLEMAKNIFPVIEVDAGRKVDFIMIKGVSLKPATSVASGGGRGLSGTAGQGGGGAQSRTGLGAVSGLMQGGAGNALLNGSQAAPLLNRN
jgi:conjugal transfer pilus assembly protein TraB